MEELRSALRSFGRYLELRELLYFWEIRQKELEQSTPKLREDRDWKKAAVEELREPGFLQRLLGRTEEKREKAQNEYRKASEIYQAALRETEELEHKLQQGREEYQALSGSRENWEQKRQMAQEETPAEWILEALAPAVVAAVSGAIPALWEARVWMQEDARRKGVREENRKLEYLNRAKQHACGLQEIILFLPEGAAEISGYVHSPEGYILGVSSEFKQLDRVNSAMEQLRALRERMKTYIKE